MLQNILLMGYEVSCFTDWTEFDRSLPLCQCSVVAVTRPVEERVVTLLRRMVRRSGADAAGSWPVVVVQDGGEDVCAGILRSIPQTTIELSRSQSALVDAISQEVARATLRYLENQMRGSVMHATLRGALLIVIREDEPAHTVRGLALRTQIGAATIHHHWISDRLSELTGMTPKEFLDVVLLLKVRARKTPRLAWRDVAAEYGASEEHLQAVYRHRVGPWRAREAGGWLKLADRVRLLTWPITAREAET